MTEKLKPCPFCGGEAKRFAKRRPDSYIGWYVRCSKCSSLMTPYLRKTLKEAVELWNENVERLIRVAQIVTQTQEQRSKEEAEPCRH